MQKYSCSTHIPNRCNFYAVQPNLTIFLELHHTEKYFSPFKQTIDTDLPLFIFVTFYSNIGIITINKRKGMKGAV